MSAKTSHHTPTRQNANLVRRLLAMVYDSILVFATLFCSAAIYVAITIALSADVKSGIGEVETDQVVHEIPQVPVDGGIWFYLAVIGVGFYVYFWKARRQTLGMRAWKLELHNADGNDLKITQLIIRAIAAILSFMLLGIGYWWMLIDKQGATLHDRLSRTRVSMPTKSKK